MGLWGKKKEEGQSKVAQLSEAYYTAFKEWKEWLKKNSGEEPPAVLGEVQKEHENLKRLLKTANKKGNSWDSMIMLANSVKYAAEKYSKVSERGLALERDAIRTVNILEQLKAKEQAEQDKEEAQKDNYQNPADTEEEGAELDGGRRKRKSKKVKKSKKSKKPKRSRRGKKQIKKTKKYKKRSNKKI